MPVSEVHDPQYVRIPVRRRHMGENSFGLISLEFYSVFFKGKCTGSVFVSNRNCGLAHMPSDNYHLATVYLSNANISSADAELRPSRHDNIYRQGYKSLIHTEWRAMPQLPCNNNANSTSLRTMQSNKHEDLQDHCEEVMSSPKASVNVMERA
ncbi:hypothetical protein CAPTEDRAFT_213756 [Capitella teleta]|uniref:Uncharacterized protein n=1 Tax=Capitella teleta TaxID=283909 RepID=R7U772_CAPTE|nr:hypothetical protein CAPTEDRAFT_213756 [Capitella teleta]|eukprot:ELU02220.1 hypothetical protein CAPTEDRAFT_213756 [Capitella teleta]